ncbi:P-loop containing nucleoside triphosphate hydrolase protein [Xylariaceae sp. AK1471]|nr:P-loop containing nucleoside triphosphate hydrolase protein [Xylariaceae sp. AK1471]
MRTPHQGGSGVQLGSILVNVASIFIAANDRILKHLERDSEWLQQQLSQYNPISGDFITKFANETYKTPTMLGHRILVVLRASAVVPGQADAEPIAIHTDHINMVKFSENVDRGYIKVSETLQIMAKDAGGKIRLRWETEARVDNVVGLGGVGKTQVALQFAYWVKENKPNYSIFWVQTSNDASFEQSYTEVARLLDIHVKSDEDLKESVRRCLESEKAGQWLLIVDNADDKEILFGSSAKPSGIDEYLPESDNGLTLFTTRSREVAVAVAGSDVVDLHGMNLEEATGFLGKTLINKQLLHDKPTTEELFQELTYLPLAITQAAAYINQNQISIKKYLALLRSTEQDLVSLMSREFHDNTRYRESQNAVATAWLVSFDQIRRSDSTAAELLSFVSCIEPKAIPQSILPGPPVEEEMEHAIGVLCEYAFWVRRGDDDMFDMHRLVHVATRVWIQKHNVVKKTKNSAIEHLASIFPWDGKENPLEETYWWREQYLPEEDYDRLASEHSLATAYLDNKQIKEAIEMFEHVVAVRKKTLVEEDHDRLVSKHQLVSAYINNGQIKEAIKMLEHVVVLASAYLDNKQVKKAIEMLEHVVAVCEKTLVKVDYSRLASEQMLASAYLSNKQIKEAIKMLEHVVTIEKTLDIRHIFDISPDKKLEY